MATPFAVPITSAPMRRSPSARSHGGNHVSPVSPLLLPGTPNLARRSHRRTRLGFPSGKPPGFPGPFHRAESTSSRSSLHREGQRPARSELPIDLRGCLALADRPAHRFEPALVDQLVPGLDESLETHVV